MNLNNIAKWTLIAAAGTIFLVGGLIPWIVGVVTMVDRLF